MSRRRRLAPPPQSQAAPAVIARSASADSGSETTRRPFGASQDGQPAAPAREAFSLVINPLPVHSILSRSLYQAEDARNVPLPCADSPCLDCGEGTDKVPACWCAFRWMFQLSGSRTFRPGRAVVATADAAVALPLPTTRRGGPQGLPSAKSRLAEQDVSTSGRDPVGKTHALSTPVIGCLRVKRRKASVNPQPLANRENHTDV